MNAKYHSNLQKVNQLDVKNVSKRTGPREISAETIVDSATITDSTADQEKCTKQPVQTAEKTAKCHSSQQKANQYDAKNVSKHLETKLEN